MYNRGDILFLHNIRFKNNNCIDTRIKGHPVLVLNDVEDIGDTIYFLFISGVRHRNWKYSFEIRPNERNGLRKVSYLSLKNIYETSSTGIPCCGYLSDAKMEEVEELIENSKKDKTYFKYLDTIKKYKYN